MKEKIQDQSTDSKTQIVVTEAKIKETIADLKNQLTEAQTKVVMLQGAIQISEHMLIPDTQTTNGAINDGK